MVKTRRNKLVLLIAMLTSFLLGGCATSGQSGALPDWALSPPKDTHSTIYGVGEGLALRGARDDALAVIAGKLETRVTSDVQTETVLTDGQESSTTRNRVRTSTEALKLSDFRTVNSAEAGSRLLVLVSIDRQSLVDSILEDVDQLSREIEARIDGAETNTLLKRLYRLTLARGLISEAIDKVRLAQSASQNGGLRQATLSRYQTLLDERERMQQSLVLAVTWDRATPGIGERLLTTLLELGLQAEAAGSGKNYDGVIEVTGNPSRREIFSEYHLQLKAVVALKDSEGSEISSAHYEAAASSLTDFDLALRTTNRLIAEEIHERGLWRALNMHNEP